MFDQIILAIWFRLRAGHRQGRGVHSPFAYEFIREVIFGENAGGLEGIEDLRRSLLRNRDILEADDPGAGSRKFKGRYRSIRKLVRHTSVNEKKGRLLARISSYLGFPVLLEMGAGAGISSLYLGKACPRSKLLTCEGSPAIAALALANFQLMGASNIEVAEKKFIDWLPVALNQSPSEVFIYVDGDHRGERLLEYIGTILGAGPSKAVMVLDDIHWSWDMHRAWKKLVSRDAISLSLELYNTGIVFIGYDIQKGHYTVNI